LGAGYNPILILGAIIIVFILTIERTHEGNETAQQSQQEDAVLARQKIKWIKQVGTTVIKKAYPEGLPGMPVQGNPNRWQ